MARPSAPLDASIVPNPPTTKGPPPIIRITAQPDGTMHVQFLLGYMESKRLRLKAGSMDLERYLLENILKPAISSALY